MMPVRLLEAANTPIDRVCQIEGTIYGVVMVRSDVVGGTCAAGEPRSVWYTASITGNETTSVRYAQRYAPLSGGSALLSAGRWVQEVVSSRNHGIQSNSVFALANDGRVYAWGNLNNQGQLGLGSTGAVAAPQLAPGWEGARRIAAAGEVTLALMADGSIKGAGWNPSASLGIGPVSSDVVSTPTALPGIAGAHDVSTASNRSGSMALVNGQLRYWGSNDNFANGVQAVPIAIAAPATPLSSVSVGGYVAVAIGPGSVVYAWGDATLRGCEPNGTDCNAPTPLPTMVTLPPEAPAGMSLLAGDFSAGGGGNSGDGVGSTARFDVPEGLVADRAGNLYVAQTNGNRVSRISPAAAAATIYRAPQGSPSVIGSLAFGPGGVLYGASVSYCYLHRITGADGSAPVGQEIALSGCSGSRGVAIDASGVAHMSEPQDNSVWRALPADPANPGGAWVNGRWVGGLGSEAGAADGQGAAARFTAPRGAVFAANGDLLIADSGNHTIRRVTPAGVVSTYAGSAGQRGTVDGSGAAARFDNPTDLAFDGLGNLYVLQRGDPANNPVAHVRRIAPDGTVSTLFNATAESVALAAPGQEPFAREIRGLAVLDDGRIALAAGNAILLRRLP